MRKLMTTTHGSEGIQPRFHSVAETARILGVSEMTVYRAIRGGQFPAVQLMGRLIIPARVIDEIIDAAIDSGALVDTEEWTPHPGAGSHAARRRVRGEAFSLSEPDGDRAAARRSRADGSGGTL